MMIMLKPRGDLEWSWRDHSLKVIWDKCHQKEYNSSINSLGNDDDAASRLLGFTTGLALGSRLFGNRPNVNNNQPRPFAQLGLTSPVQLNPNFPNLLTTFDSCTSPNGQSGICTPGKVCGMFGGQPSGSCLFGGVCCVSKWIKIMFMVSLLKTSSSDTVSTCVGGTVTLNNTFWQSPTDRPVDSSSSCILNIKIDNRLVEQKKPICQVRYVSIQFVWTDLKRLFALSGWTLLASQLHNLTVQRSPAPPLVAQRTHSKWRVPPMWFPLYAEITTISTVFIEAIEFIQAYLILCFHYSVFTRTKLGRYEHRSAASLQIRQRKRRDSFLEHQGVYAALWSQLSW